MAKIHVGKTLLSTRSLEDALHRSKPGDELIVHEGLHQLESFNINGIHLTGAGDPANIVIEGQVNVWAESRISNLTLRASHFHNALYLRQHGARVDLTSAAVHADPAGKYPAIYGEGGIVVMSATSVHASPSDHSIVLKQGGYLHARDSRVTGISLQNSRAVLADVHATHIECLESSKIEGFGKLTVSPTQKKWLLLLSKESVFTAPSLRIPDGYRQVFCRDSYMKVDSVHAPTGGRVTVIKEGQSVVDCTSDSVKVHDPTAKPEPAPAPKTVPWKLTDARSFRTAVAPHLRRGDTVQLEEGDYFLDDYANKALGIAAHVIGGGRRTVIHGKVFVLSGQDASLRHLTIRAPHNNNGVANVSGGKLTMADVVIEPSNTDYPAVFIKSGTTEMHHCTVVASDDAAVGATSVKDGARLEATESSIGWLRTEGRGNVSLRHCSALQLWATTGSSITSRGNLFVTSNTCEVRQVIAQSRSTISLESLTTDVSYFEALADASTLNIDWLNTTEPQADAIVAVQDAKHVAVEGPAVSVVELETLTQAAAEANNSEPSGVGPADQDSSGPSRSDPDVAEEGEFFGDDEAAAADPLAEIEALTGLTTVKKQIRKFTRMVQYNQMREQQGKPKSPMVMHSLFLGNPGTGKTTVARLLKTALYQAGAIRNDTFVEAAGRADLVRDTIGTSGKRTLELLEQALGGVLFIDEAHSLYQSNANQFAEEAVTTIMTFLENHRDDIVVVFAGYGEQMQDFLGMDPGLKSRITNRFDFEDYTPEEVAEIGYRELINGHHTVNEELYRRIVATEYSRSTDRSNGRWVRNLNQELIATLAERVLDLDLDDVDVSHITDEDLHALVGGDAVDKEQRVQELLTELDAMVGLAPVKDWVRRLVNRAKVDRRRMERDGTSTRPTYHMVFAGNPGTGKTTVARIVAQLFHELDILQTPTVKEVKKSQLIGGYIGHTEKNTTKIVDEAMGGVLFVDEAYELSTASTNDFGSNVIATLLPRLEDDREKFVAIFAGYSQEMRGFLEANPGLHSRVPGWIEFPDYTATEVGQIVVAHLAKQWTFDAEHVAAVASSVYARTPAERQDNGRWARNFAEDLEAEQNDYLATHDIDGEALDRIPAEVIDRMDQGLGV